MGYAERQRPGTDGVTNEAPRPNGEDPILERAFACAEAALAKKATEVVVLDLRGVTSIADAFVIASGRSDTQVRAIADAIQERCRASGLRPLAVEGADAGRWILIDYGDFVVHVFHAPVREFYDLERLWSHARRCELPEALATRAQPA